MAPFQSKAQRRKFGELVKQGKMTQEEFNKWNSETPLNIPDRVGPKKVGFIKVIKPKKASR